MTGSAARPDGIDVWAPHAHRVSVEIEGERHALRPADGGWWKLERALARELEAGERDYAFVLDDGEPLPDPRAPRLPYGVAGPARRVDHAAFSWRDHDWQPPPLASGVLYELHVGTFSPEGTFDGAIERLDALVELGVTHVELMPVASFPGTRGWGYDGVGLFAPQESYGGPDGLKRLVDAAHARGLAILLDVVYNHLGPSGNVLPRFGPYFTDRHRTPWGDALNLDGPGSDEVRRFLCDNAIAWLRDYHFDGLRLDAVHALVDRSAHPFLAQLREEVDALQVALGRHLCLIAESDSNDPRLVSPRGIGLAMDAQWSDDFHHALHACLTGERHGYYADFGRLEDLAKALTSAFVYDGSFSPHRGRSHGAPVRGISGHRFLGYLQNHDQVGNRPLGERIGVLSSLARQRIGAALVFTSPFVPLLFQGEEWGAGSPFLYFTEHDDPELVRAIREGRRRELVASEGDPDQSPDPQGREAFDRSRLDWKEREREPHAGLLSWYTRLIHLRRIHPELGDGDLDGVTVQLDEAERWLCVVRGELRVACNLSSERRIVPLGGGGNARVVLASDADVRLPWPAGTPAVELPADAVAIVSVSDLHDLHDLQDRRTRAAARRQREMRAHLRSTRRPRVPY